MLFSDPVNDFFVRASMHAKHIRMSELNHLEAELILLEETIIDLRQKGLAHPAFKMIDLQIESLQAVIDKKKKELMVL